MSRDLCGYLLVCVILILGAISGGGAVAQEGVLEKPQSGKLYFSVGAIDTAKRSNLLAADRFEPDRAHVIQLGQQIDPELRVKLTDAGVILADYIHKDAFIADLSAASPAALSGLGFVRWVGEFDDAWKLDPEFGQIEYGTSERQELRARGDYPVIITLFAGRSKDAIAEQIESLAGARLHYTERVSGNETISATLTEEQVMELVQSPEVQYIEEAAELTSRNNSIRWVVQSNVLNVEPIYDNGIHGEGQIVGVLDGRADQHHCSLDDGKILFYNSSDGNDTHGTHVSATAVGDNGQDANQRGVAYLANLVFNTTPSFNEAAILQRLNLHHSQGGRLHTNSWGNDGTTSYNSLARGFDSFLYDNEDSFVALAVTNQGSLRNPENAKNLVAVGASFDTPSQASHCSGGAGPTADGRRKPELYAPGCNITSAFPSSCSVGNLSGTSMASPAIAGAAALARQYYVDGYYPSGEPSANGFTPSGALIKATLLNGAVDMTGVSGYPTNLEGWGRLLLDNALYFPGDTRRMVLLADKRNASGLSTGQIDSFPIIINGGAERLNVTLVWMDPPAASTTGGGAAYINDLNLEMTISNPFPTVYKGNVFSAGQSTTGGTADFRNNVEQIQINSPGPGTWTVKVVANSVNVGLQGYALLVSGDVTVCGNNLIDVGETCDPPGQPAGGNDECRNECTYCGDSLVNADEECDDGNAIDGDGCSPICVTGCLDADLDAVCSIFDNCPLTPNPDQGAPAPFAETILAEDVDTFGWTSPADVEWVVGDLADVGSYGWFTQDSASSVVSIPATDTPDAGDGYYWLLAPNCSVGSWTSGGAAECEPASSCPAGGRDGNLPAP